MSRRVVVTGLAIWCSIATNLEEFETGLRNGVSGRRPVTRFDVSDSAYRTKEAAVLKNEDISLLTKTDNTLLSDLALIVARQAMADAGISFNYSNPYQVGICLGTTHGGNFAFIKFVKGRLGLPDGAMAPELNLSTAGTIAGTVAHCLGVRGQIVTTSNACAAGTSAVGYAYDLVKSGRLYCAIAGGVDMFSELSFSGFNSLQLLSPTQCRPFDKNRDGMMLGDGAGFLILEDLEKARERGARIYAEILGYATANEAYHITSPDPSGAVESHVMREALKASGLSVLDIDYIKAHGTGTRVNDPAEIKAIENVFSETFIEKGKTLYVSSPKSMVGHTLGASGAIELIATIIGLYQGFIPPTINLREPLDTASCINLVPNKSIAAKMEFAMSNAFGFGGNLASIAIRRYTQDE